MKRNLPMGILKSSPDSFVVQEVVSNNGNGSRELVPLADQTVVRGWDHRSPITIFELTKSGWSTEDALRLVARQFRTSFGFVERTGLKDKHALTSQRIAVKGAFYPKFCHSQVFLNQLSGAQRLARHLANHFSIFILTDAEAIDLGPARKFANFFGPQRLGIAGSERIGRMLFEGKYADAADLIMTMPEGKKLGQAQAQGQCSLSEALFHPSFQFHLRFALEKWQSFLWNELLGDIIASGAEVPERLPMWSTRPDIAGLYRNLWAPSCHNGSMGWALRLSKPFSRPTIVKPADLAAEKKPHGWEIRFTLPPGCYATVLLARMFDLEEVHL